MNDKYNCRHYEWFEKHVKEYHLSQGCTSVEFGDRQGTELDMKDATDVVVILNKGYVSKNVGLRTRSNTYHQKWPFDATFRNKTKYDKITEFDKIKIGLMNHAVIGYENKDGTGMIGGRYIDVGVLMCIDRESERLSGKSIFKNKLNGDGTGFAYVNLSQLPRIMLDNRKLVLCEWGEVKLPPAKYSYEEWAEKITSTKQNAKITPIKQHEICQLSFVL